MNVQGSIDLLKLEMTGVATINGKRCVVIPIEENDIYISADTQTHKAKGAYLALSIYERREPSEYGKTHYAKQSFSKNYRETHEIMMEAKRNIYLGDFKTFTFEGGNQAETVTAPVAQVQTEGMDDLPF